MAICRNTADGIRGRQAYRLPPGIEREHDAKGKKNKGGKLTTTTRNGVNHSAKFNVKRVDWSICREIRPNTDPDSLHLTAPPLAGGLKIIWSGDTPALAPMTATCLPFSAAARWRPRQRGTDHPG